MYLEEYTQHLERQKVELVRAQKALEANALALERASQYKSEFLANMSHELRTPLNSSLILAKFLQDNKHGNLSDERVRYAATIHSSNSDLLSLINDILDLSKVEAGQMDVQFAPVSIDGMLQSLRQPFAPIADSKRLKLVTERAGQGQCVLGHAAAGYSRGVNGGQKATPDGGVDQKCETILFCRTVF